MPAEPLDTLPLERIPFNSRITSEFSNGLKNYVLVGFNPGYSLQASELNEIQELFFLNQSLTTRMMAKWTSSEYKIPFWEGLIPLSPVNNNIGISNVSLNTTGIVNFTVSISPGWFLWTDSSSKLSFWIYFGEALVQELSTSPGGVVTSQHTEYVGFDISTKYVLCCPSTNCGENDSTLRDNSTRSGDVFFTCGASRVKAEFAQPLQIQIRDDIASNFYPIFKIRVNLEDDGGYVSEISYMDDQILN